MVLLKKFKIQNYLLLENAEIEIQENLNAIIGENNSGKSSIMDALLFVKSAVTGNADNAVCARGGFDKILCMNGKSDKISFEMDFGSDDGSQFKYSFCLSGGNKTNVDYEFFAHKPDRQNDYNPIIDFTNGCGKILMGNNSLVMQVDPGCLGLKGGSVFRNTSVPDLHNIYKFMENIKLFEFDCKNAGKACDMSHPDNFISENCDNIPKVLKGLMDENPDKFQELQENIRKVMPHIESVIPVVFEDGRMVVKFIEKDTGFEFFANKVSSGTLSAFTHILVSCHDNHSLLLMKNPEILHNTIDEPVIRFIETHSTDILAKMQPENVFFVRRDKKISTVTRTDQCEQVMSLVEAGDDMGSLWSQGVIDYNVMENINSAAECNR